MNTFDNQQNPQEEEHFLSPEENALVDWDRAESTHQEPQTQPMENYRPQSAAPVYGPEQGSHPNPAPVRQESPFANSPYMTYDQGYRPAAAQPQAPTYSAVPQNSQPKPEKQRSGRPFWKTALAGVLVLALVAVSCFATAAVVNTQWQQKADRMTQDSNARFEEMNRQIQDLQQRIDAGTGPVVIPGNPVSSDDWMTPAQVYALNVNAVVMVHSEIVYSQFGQTGTGTSTGSGFIITEDGYVLTNYHVVEGATSVSISRYDGKTHKALVVGYDDTNDVALLKVDAEGLPYVSIGSSAMLNVGDQVVAIGNPLGELTSTMTVGYVSGKERSVTTDGTTINMLQTDAAINSGNSGGPLFNMQGQVVGITTAKYSGESSSGASIEGIGFAIPIDDVMAIVEELQEFGYIKTAYMGVVVREMTDEMKALAELYNMPVGLHVDSTEAGGPAEAAGILPEDIILALGQTRVTGINELTRALRDYEPGDTTTITVFRSGEELELTITLTEKPRDTDAGQPTPAEPSDDMPTDGDYEQWRDHFFPNG